jgi:hypothetical protein
MSTLAPRLASSFTVEAPVIAGPLAVFPLIADRSPSLHYVSFTEAMKQGATVTELPQGASVNDLMVHNPLDVPVLLYEGQEVLGAQQNRTLDVSVLIAPRSVLTVPVSCVEAGRWDSARSTEAFAPSPQTANPRLRQMKNTQARASQASGLEGRAIQGEVWREVAETAGRHGVASDTDAMYDVFEGQREPLESISESVEMCCSQVGMLAAVGGKFVVLDHISEVEAFATLHGPLVQGYALDALEADTAPAPSIEDARDFVELLMQAPFTTSPSVGLGEGVSFAFGGLAGSGLICDGELVTLSAFPQDPQAQHGQGASRVARPSRRRPR